MGSYSQEAVGVELNPGHSRTGRNMSHVVTCVLFVIDVIRENFKGELVLLIQTCEFRLLLQFGSGGSICP